jgi:hypothetical protein
VYSFQNVGSCWVSGVCTSSEWRLVDGVPVRRSRAYKCPTELKAPKEKAAVNDGRGQRVLLNVYCLKQRLETSAAKDVLLLSNATTLGNARRYLCAAVSISGGD